MKTRIQQLDGVVSINTPRWRSRVVLAALALFLLGASLPTAAQEGTKEQERFIDVMSKYLDFSTRYVKIAQHPHAILHLTVESIVETYEARGEGAKAIGHLRGLLTDSTDRTARNILRMKIRDLLVQYNRSDEALDELDALFRENNNANPRPENLVRPGARRPGVRKPGARNGG